MKKLINVLSAVIFLSAISGAVQAAQPAPVAKTTVKMAKHKNSGKAKKGKTMKAVVIPPKQVSTPPAQPPKHWWKFW